MRFKDLEDQRIERERIEWKKFRGHFAEDDSTRPVDVKAVLPGSICRMWFAPNQSRFVVIGNAIKKTGNDVTSMVVREDGNVMGLVPDALVVIVEHAPKDFPDLIYDLAKFNDHMQRSAWAGRSPAK